MIRKWYFIFSVGYFSPGRVKNNLQKVKIPVSYPFVSFVDSLQLF